MMSALQTSVSFTPSGRRRLMVGQHDHSDDAKTGEPAVDRPALRIELQASEQVWVSVRNSLRLWASDSSLSTVSPEVAWPLKISIDEIDPPSGQCGVGTVRLNLGWAPLENAALAERAAEPIAETAVPASPAETPEQNP